MTEKRFKQWLRAVCKDYLIAIRDGRKGDLRRRSLHILIIQTCHLNSTDIDEIFWNLDRYIGLEVDKLNKEENIKIYTEALFNKIIENYFGIFENHKYEINNLFPR